MIRFMRTYQKWVFWGVVLFILPSFSITWVMQELVQRRNAVPAGVLFGEDISQEDYQRIANRIQTFDSMYGRENPDSKRIWEHILMVREADRSGIKASDAEVADAARNFYKQVIAYQRASEKLSEMPQLTREQQMRLLRRYAQEEMPNAVFDETDYLQMFEGRSMASAEFELTLREMLRVQRLQQLVQASAKPKPSELYDRYQNENHTRRAQYLAFNAKDFAVSKDNLDDEDIAAFYAEQKARFAEPLLVSIQYAAVAVSTFADAVQSPTEAELSERYNATKERYRLDASTNPDLAIPGVEAQYRPLQEVSAEISLELTAERLRKAARVDAAAVRTGVLSSVEAGAELDLAQAVTATYIVKTTEKVKPEELVDDPIIADWSLLTTIDRLAPGSLSEVYVNDTHACFYRVVTKREARTPPLEEIRTQVVAAFLNPPADELRRFFDDNSADYIERARVSVEVISVQLKQFARGIDPELDGEDRHAALLAKAAERLATIAQQTGELDDEGNVKDLESVALEIGADHKKLTVQASGTDLPANYRVPELEAALLSADEAKRGLSETLETTDGEGAFAFRILGRTPERTPAFEDVEDRVRADVLASRGLARAMREGERFVEDLGATSSEFALKAKAENRALETTALLSRSDKPESLGDASSTFVSQLFGQSTVGTVFGPIEDKQSKRVLVVRYTTKQPAPAEGFASKHAELAKTYGFFSGYELQRRWHLNTRLQARGVGDNVLDELHELHYGERGLVQIEAAQIYIAADVETIDSLIATRAAQRAERLHARIAAGAIAFEIAARKYSEDDASRRKGGRLGLSSEASFPAGLVKFANEATLGQLTGPVKTDQGYHLLRVDKRDDKGSQCRHILFRSQRGLDANGKPRMIPTVILDQAMAKAETRAQELRQRLADGESFEDLAKAESDDPGTATKQNFRHDSSFVRAVFAAPTRQMSEVLTLENRPCILLVELASTASEFDEDTSDPRVVRAIFGTGDAGAAQLAAVRTNLLAMREEINQERAAGGAEPYGQFRALFEEQARGASASETAKLDGLVGLVRPATEVDRWGSSFRETLYSLKPGDVSGVVQCLEGFHIVKVYSHEQQTSEETRPQLAELLLEAIER